MHHCWVFAQYNNIPQPGHRGQNKRLEGLRGYRSAIRRFSRETISRAQSLALHTDHPNPESYPGFSTQRKGRYLAKQFLYQKVTILYPITRIQAPFIQPDPSLIPNGSRKQRHHSCTCNGTGVRSVLTDGHRIINHVHDGRTDGLNGGISTNPPAGLGRRSHNSVPRGIHVVITF